METQSIETFKKRLGLSLVTTVAYPMEGDKSMTGRAFSHF
jgi:hypothetical protein